ncbi:hypothetical protein ACLOJK_027837 [Asimina triloba]
MKNALFLLLLLRFPLPSVAAHDYLDALSKSILFFEGQRSGRLPPNQRLAWRRDSALADGYQGGVDLIGGYYDAGDNVKFGFPMAFTTTMLSWSVIEFGNLMPPAEVYDAMAAIRWATDYLLKTIAQPGRIFVQVRECFSKAVLRFSISSRRVWGGVLELRFLRVKQRIRGSMLHSFSVTRAKTQRKMSTEKRLLQKVKMSNSSLRNINFLEFIFIFKSILQITHTPLACYTLPTAREQWRQLGIGEIREPV